MVRHDWTKHIPPCGGFPVLWCCPRIVTWANSCWLVVFRHPSEKWWSSSVGMMTFPIYGKIIIQMFQTANQVVGCCWFVTSQYVNKSRDLADTGLSVNTLTPNPMVDHHRPCCIILALTWVVAYFQTPICAMEIWWEFNQHTEHHLYIVNSICAMDCHGENTWGQCSMFIQASWMEFLSENPRIVFWQWHIVPLVHQMIGMLAIHPTSSVVPVTLSKRPFALSILMAFPAILFCNYPLAFDHLSRPNLVLVLPGIKRGKHSVWFDDFPTKNFIWPLVICYIAIENMAQSK